MPAKQVVFYVVLDTNSLVVGLLHAALVMLAIPNLAPAQVAVIFVSLGTTRLRVVHQCAVHVVPDIISLPTARLAWDFNAHIPTRHHFLLPQNLLTALHFVCVYKIGQ